jgi:integrase
MPRPRRDGTRAAPPKCFNLSQRKVDRAAPESLPYSIWDKRTRGLCLKVYPSGRRAWYCVYRKAGRAEWLHVGDASTIPLVDARRRMQRVAVQVSDGKDPVAERRAARVGTFAEVVERYFNEHAKRRNKSWAQSYALVRRFLLPRWGRMQPASITRSDVRAMMSSIEAPVVCNQAIAAASAIFRWCVGMEIIAVNPCVGVARNPTKSRERILSDDEIKRFWTAFDTAGLVRGAALKLILLLGQRPGEICCMRREHIRDDGWWELPGTPVPDIGWPGTKNGASHAVFLSPPARAIISELTDGEAGVGFVFATERGNAVDGLDRAMRDLCRSLDVAVPARPHDLRRTFGSTVTGLGLGRQCMDRLLNHADHSIASVYDRHPYRRENQVAWERVAAHIVAIATGEPAADNVVRLA